MNEGDIVEYVQMSVREISKSNDNGRWIERLSGWWCWSFGF